MELESFVFATLIFQTVWIVLYSTIVTVKVLSLSRMFQTDAGLQTFSTRVMSAFVFSALTIPAHIFRALSSMRAQASEEAAAMARAATEGAVDGLGQTLGVKVKK